MEKLFTPDTGLMVWTAVVFVALVALLGRYAWGPILKAIALREEGIRRDIDSARAARLSADQLRTDYEAQLARADERAQQRLAEADAQARRLKEDMRRAAEADNAALLESSRRTLADEERRLADRLRSEVAVLSLRATEKMIRQTLDKSAQDRLVEEALADVEAWARR